MKRAAALLAAAVLLAPAAGAQSEIVPGEYPEPLPAAVEGMIEDGPSPGNASETAERFLQRARAEHEAGNLSMAIENLQRHRVAIAEEELVRELEDLRPVEGQNRADRRLELLAREGRAAVALAHQHLDELALENLTQQGLDAALWGAVLVARGQMQLNLHDTEVDAKVYSGGQLQRGQLSQRLATAMGGHLLASIGLEIASRAPDVPGEPLDADEAHRRLSQAANRSIATRQSNVPDYLPEGTPEDSALVRTALVHVTAVEVRIPEFYRTFGRDVTPGTVTAMQNALRFDREKLGPRAEAGFPFARAGFEEIALVNPGQLQDPARRAPQRAHAIAIVTAETHEHLFPNATAEAAEDQSIPGPGALAALAALAAGWAARRRRS